MSGIHTLTAEPTFHGMVRAILRHAYLIILLVGLVLLALGPKVLEEEKREEESS